MQTKTMASLIVLYPKSVPEQYWQLLSNQAAFTLRAAAVCRNRQPPRASSPLGRQVDTLHVQWRGAKVHSIVNPILCYFDFPGRTQFLSSKNQTQMQYNISSSRGRDCTEEWCSITLPVLPIRARNTQTGILLSASRVPRKEMMLQHPQSPSNCMSFW